MKKILTALLVAATALSPVTAAYAQREGRENVREEGTERAPRGPEMRQWNRGERRNPAPEVRGQAERPRDQYRDGSQDRQRGEWRRNQGTDTVRQPRPDTPRVDTPRANTQRQDWGNRGGDGYDRNRDGNANRYGDRNNNGRVDRQWDRNRDGNIDRRYDRNDNNRVDRQWDRNRDGNLDRRYDGNRDGRVDRYRHEDRRYRQDDRRYRDNDRRYGNSGWNHSWRNDRRYNWSGHRQQYRDHYRLGSYYAPVRNHRYSRFSIGIRIGSPFYSNRYWINDPWSYRLPEVGGSYRWVRYYDDVLLVDVYSGEVVDVIHNFFW